MRVGAEQGLVMKFTTRAALFLVAAAAIPAAADATVTIDINQVGGDVVATLSGDLNLTGLSLQPNPYSLSAGIEGQSAYIGMGAGGESMAGYLGLSGPLNFGTGGYVPSSSSTGDAFSLNGSGFGPTYVFVPDGYVSGTALSGTTTWSGTTLALLGLAPGQYTFSGPRLDQVIINIAGGVPEPGTWAMMLVGFGAIGFAMRRKRDADAAVALPA
jgi:hypothetical protein